MEALQRKQKFWLVGHNAFGRTNNWPVCVLILALRPVLKKSIKIGATRCQILRLKCTKVAFR